jgi:hypothetical protein
MVILFNMTHAFEEVITRYKRQPDAVRRKPFKLPMQPTLMAKQRRMRRQATVSRVARYCVRSTCVELEKPRCDTEISHGQGDVCGADSTFFHHATPVRRRVYQEALDLCALADSPGYATVKIVGTIRAYGVTVPAPDFCCRGSAHASVRLVTGAVIPAPPSSEISRRTGHGRLHQRGRLRRDSPSLPSARLSLEVDMEESRPRFEGIAIVKRL